MRLLSLRAAAALVLAACGTLPATGQDRGDLPFPRGGAPVQRAGVAGTPLEGVLDARGYRIGPGDVFTVSIGGAQAASLPVPVTADGVVVLPEAGAVRVANLTLAEARERIVAALRPYYRSGVDAALAQPRSFYVHVAGAVPAPGRKAMGPVARLEDALALAFVVLDSAAAATAPVPALRRILVEHRDGTAGRYDLLRYRRNGDLAQNPYLTDGDNVVVPASDPRDTGVRVSGDVAFPGLYDTYPGDTVLGLLTVADGAPRAVETRTIRVGDAAPVAVANLVAGRAAVPAPAPGSVVYVEGDRLRGTASVEGAVRFPGPYPIRQGETTLREVLASAGGLRPEALTRGAYLVRGGGDGAARPFDAAYRAVQSPGDFPFVTRIALADQFFEARLAVPLGEAVTGGAGADLVLYDGDRLVVPRDEGTVFVVGGVTRSGYVPVRAGARASDYVEAAGGLRREARGVFVADAGTQGLRPAGDAVLGSGDVVFVTTDDPATRPELYGFALQERQLALQNRQERRQARLSVVQTALTAVSTGVAILTTYLLVRDSND